MLSDGLKHGNIYLLLKVHFGQKLKSNTLNFPYPWNLCPGAGGGGEARLELKESNVAK